jgi:hypothetical protein
MILKIEFEYLCKFKTIAHDSMSKVYSRRRTMVFGWLFWEGILHPLRRRHPLSFAGLLSLCILQFLLLCGFGLMVVVVVGGHAASSWMCLV